MLAGLGGCRMGRCRCETAAFPNSPSLPRRIAAPSGSITDASRSAGLPISSRPGGSSRVLFYRSRLRARSQLAGEFCAFGGGGWCGAREAEVDCEAVRSCLASMARIRCR